MKKLLAILLVLLLTFSLVACGNDENTDPSGSDNPGVSQSGENDDDQGGESTVDGSEKNNGGEETNGNETDFKPWPESDITALVPTPAQGKVTLASIDETSAIIEVTWTYDEVLAYVQQLQDAGFGDDAVEKFEQLKTLKRTHNGVEVYLVYLNDTWTQINITKK